MTFLLDMIVSLTENGCSAENTWAKSADTESASIEGIAIGAAYTKITCIGNISTYVGGVNISIWGTNIKDNFIKNTCIRYAGCIGVVKHLEIYLWSFQILELRQYNPILETRIRASWCLLHFHLESYVYWDLSIS